MRWEGMKNILVITPLMLFSATAIISPFSPAAINPTDLHFLILQICLVSSSHSFILSLPYVFCACPIIGDRHLCLRWAVVSGSSVRVRPMSVPVPSLRGVLSN